MRGALYFLAIAIMSLPQKEYSGFTIMITSFMWVIFIAMDCYELFYKEFDK